MVPANITVLDLEAYSGLTLEQLGQQAIANIATSKAPEISERWLRKTYGLAKDLPLEQALRRKVTKHIARYRSEWPKKSRAFFGQAHDCVQIALERRYLTAASGFTLVITDDLLHRGLPSDLRCWVQPYHVCTFDCGRNAVVVSHALPNLIVAHEVGHALSCRREQQQRGFLRLQQQPDGLWHGLGANWFDEGVTLLWEELSVNDGSTLPERHDPSDVYCWYRDATLALLEVLELNQETALRAYFGNNDSRAAVEARAQQRFHCRLDDLRHVGLYQKIEFTRRLVRGEPIQHKLPGATSKVRRDGVLQTKPNTEIIEKWRRLAEIFPNLTLIERKG